MKAFPIDERYTVSENGDINGVRVVRIRQYIHKSGYVYCSIGSKSYKVHRVVALTYIPNPDPIKFPDVNHKDGNKFNNHVSNLEWTNDSLNISHAFSTKLRTHFGDKNPKCKIPKSHIPIIREAISLGHTNSAIARYYKVTHNAISAIRRNKNWSTI